jgi:hypothetical protein
MNRLRSAGMEQLLATCAPTRDKVVQSKMDNMRLAMHPVTALQASQRQNVLQYR